MSTAAAEGLLIGGERTASAEGATFDVLNPATAETLATVAEAGPRDVDRAVSAALGAYERWGSLSPVTRGRVMHRFAGLVEEHAEELAQIESRNVGMPISDARGQLSMIVDVIRYYAGAVDKFFGNTIPVERDGIVLTFREPIGLVGLITPRTFPLTLAARKAADTIKRVTLELGGKSACVVFADADLEKAGRLAPFGVFENCGQDCCARSRLIVERSAKDELLEHYVAATEAIRVGMPEDPDTQVGPMISAGQRETVEGYIRTGVEEGARLVTGGDRPNGALGRGFFLRPAVLDGATNQMRVAREEIFGPVVSVITFDTEEEAIALANDTPYGLAGSVWTRDGARQLRVARGIRTGVLGVNTNSSVFVQAPFGGYKQSGVGTELGMHPLEPNTEPNSVVMLT